MQAADPRDQVSAITSRRRRRRRNRGRQNLNSIAAITLSIGVNNVAVYIVFFHINRTDLCQMIAIQPVSLALVFIHPDLNWRQQAKPLIEAITLDRRVRQLDEKPANRTGDTAACVREPGWNLDQQIVDQTSYRWQHSSRRRINQVRDILCAAMATPTWP
jgi:hypothetical protein